VTGDVRHGHGAEFAGVFNDLGEGQGVLRHGVLVGASPSGLTDDAESRRASPWPKHTATVAAPNPQPRVTWRDVARKTRTAHLAQRPPRPTRDRRRCAVRRVLWKVSVARSQSVSKTERKP
jgi:hypothetical protein